MSEKNVGSSYRVTNMPGNEDWLKNFADKKIKSKESDQKDRLIKDVVAININSMEKEAQSTVPEEIPALLPEEIPALLPEELERIKQEKIRFLNQKWNDIEKIFKNRLQQDVIIENMSKAVLQVSKNSEYYGNLSLLFQQASSLLQQYTNFYNVLKQKFNPLITEMDKSFVKSSNDDLIKEAIGGFQELKDFFSSEREIKKVELGAITLISKQIQDMKDAVYEINNILIEVAPQFEGDAQFANLLQDSNTNNQQFNNMSQLISQIGVQTAPEAIGITPEATAPGIAPRALGVPEAPEAPGIAPRALGVPEAPEAPGIAPRALGVPEAPEAPVNELGTMSIEQAPMYLNNFTNQLLNLFNSASLEIADPEGIFKENIKSRVKALQRESNSIQLLINDIKKAKTSTPALET